MILLSASAVNAITGVLDFLHNSNVGTDGKCNNFSINTLYNSRSNKP